MKTYIVGIGGSPQDNWTEFDDLDDAIIHCEEMAKEMAVEKGIDPDGVDSYQDSCGDEPYNGGACPDGDTGAYWPVVVQGERQ
jgi:hypothetical protein